MRARKSNALSPPQLPHRGKLILRLRRQAATSGLPASKSLKTVRFALTAGSFWSASVPAIAFRLRLNRGRDGYFPL